MMTVQNSYNLEQLMDTMSNIRSNAKPEDFETFFGGYNNHIWRKFVENDHDFFKLYQVLDSQHRRVAVDFFNGFTRWDYAIDMGEYTYLQLNKMYPKIASYCSFESRYLRGRDIFTCNGSYAYVLQVKDCLDKINSDCLAIQDYANIQQAYYLLDGEHIVNKMLAEFDLFSVRMVKKPKGDSQLLGIPIE